jgi:glycosyltransferase involved in cell wall biosynthesis
MMMMTDNPTSAITTASVDAVDTTEITTSTIDVLVTPANNSSLASSAVISTLYWYPFSDQPISSNNGTGITGYLRQLLPAIQQVNGTAPTVYTADNKTFKKLNFRQTEAYLATFVEQAQRFDCIHLQHEFSLFSGSYLPHQGIALFTSLLDSLAIQQAKRPVFTTFHQSPHHLNAPLKVLEQLAWKATAKRFQTGTVHWAICHHTHLRQQLIDSGFAPEKVCLIPYFVSSQTLQQHPIQPQLKNEVRQRLKLQSTDVLLGVLGFMSPKKRFEDAIKALSFLPPNYKLLIIGGSATAVSAHPADKIATYEERLVRLVYEAGLQNRVLITGLFFNEQLPTYLDCVDLFLAPYSQDFSGDFGTASFLLAAKKPLITSNCPTFLDVQYQSQCLALFQAEEVEDLVATIKQVVASPSQQAYLMEALTHYASDHCEYAIARLLLQTYKQATATLLSTVTTEGLS